MDIERAIEREGEYLSHRMKNEEPFHLVDAVKECGFDTLGEYFAAKAEHRFGQLEFGFAYVPPSEAVGEIFRMMGSGETKLLFVDSTDTFVFSGDSKPYNEAYCEDNGIPVYPLHTAGGCIVSTAGDFSVVICYPEETGCNVMFVLSKLADILGGYMEGVEFTGNDILVNGQKVCGSVMYRQNGMRCFAAHFSFNDNSELIESICQTGRATYSLRRAVKAPSFIEGMTVDEFKGEVAAWLRIRSI